MSGTDEVWIIANPSAGSGRGLQHAETVTAGLLRAGHRVRMVCPASADAATTSAAEAVGAEARAVIASGGDGTVHAVIQPLVGTDIPFGIVAAGSGDDIAAVLGWPTDDVAATVTHLDRALTAVDRGVDRRIDVGRATTADGTTRYYLAVLSSGFDSAVNERANRMPRLMGQRYNVAMVRELASFKPIAYDVTIDDDPVHASGMLVAVGNGARYGGGMRICPAAEVDDGLLDITWLGAVSKLTLLRVFPTVYSGRHTSHPSVRTFRAKRITISAADQVAYADGERVGPLPVTIQVVPRALRVLTDEAPPT